jgi:hypothetical protein
MKPAPARGGRAGGEGLDMRRVLIVVCAAGMALALTAGPAAADRSQARNYDAIEATCDGLGEVVIEVVSLGHWGTGKVQDTNLTLVPRYFAFTVTDLSTGQIVEEDEARKRNDSVDDECLISFVEEVEDDPFIPDGTYLIEVRVGVRVVGR